ncbi:MAG: DUF3127 domain-containing protein [Muribaculaceae bacterium]|nr:DUF3127 domain-containing protein [Muribaculaceae bacterium]
MELEGKVISFLGETSGTSKAGNPWKKKEWVVETFGQYPRKVKVQCFGDRADSINLEPGRDYTLSIDLESREFNGRWYTDVSVYRVAEYIGQQGGFGGQQPAAYNPGYPQNQQPAANTGMPYGNNQAFGGQPEPFAPSEGGEEDLPF